MSLLQKSYYKEILPKVKETLGLKNIMQVPQLEKVVLNIGMGKATANPKFLEQAVDELNIISGQKCVKTFSKKSIAGFKLRENQAIGCMVTLRGKRMFAFLDRLINIVLPRVRDFSGINPNSFDGRGNYNFSLKEQIVFPEINVDKVETYHGMNITITCRSKNDEESRTLLKEIGMPLRELVSKKV